MTMEYHAGIDVSLEASSVCVVDVSGKIVKETKVLSEPEALTGWFKALPFALAACLWPYLSLGAPRIGPLGEEIGLSSRRSSAQSFRHAGLPPLPVEAAGTFP
jgi:hypothetical protein